MAARVRHRRPIHLIIGLTSVDTLEMALRIVFGGERKRSFAVDGSGG
jgi:hypothetical protein